MNKKEVLLRITNDKVWFNEFSFIEIQKTNIPYNNLKFKTHINIFWSAEMLSFDNGTLKLIVNDYSVEDFSNFHLQKPKKEITFLIFEKFNWNKLEPLLSIYQVSSFVSQIDNFNLTSPNEYPEEIIKTESRKTYPIEYRLNNEEEFNVNFENSLIRTGFIEFKHFSKILKEDIEYKVYNDNLLQEFENIKFWFAKKLKTKKFKVKAKYLFSDYELVEIKTICTEIEKIDSDLIEAIKHQMTLELLKSINPNGTLFTTDELFKENENSLGVFKQNETDILNLIINQPKIRNKKELMYLSGSKQSVNYKVRFTNRPSFGFIFLVEGELNIHFIWELLNSNATYIWSIQRTKDLLHVHFQKVEKIINKIKILGRENYKNEYRTLHQDNDFTLSIVNHTDKNSTSIDSFPIWKNRINGLLK